MALHQSGEDYLEAILVLREKKGNVHSIDVAQRPEEHTSELQSPS